VSATAHPAKFSSPLLPVIERYLAGYRLVLDPMAGVGTLASYLYAHGWEQGTVWSNEMEPEWAAQCPSLRSSFDARWTPFQDAAFDAIATSPTYGNRMADHHKAREVCQACAGRGEHRVGPPSTCWPATTPCQKCGGTGRRNHKRHTYRHYLGRPLTPSNTGQMHWGKEYRDTHEAIIAECVRVLRPGGRIVWNVKDHVRKGRQQPVAAWHFDALFAAGLRPYDKDFLRTPGQRHGANGRARVEGEWVFVFDKPEATA
jgi:SAM-dependent methyltransferase